MTQTTTQSAETSKNKDCFLKRILNKIRTCFKTEKCPKGRVEWSRETKDECVRRIEKEINFYTKGANRSKCRHRWFSVLAIITAAIVPVLAATSKSIICDDWRNLIIGILGAMATVFSGLLGIYKDREKRLKYRIAANDLSEQKHLYLTRTEPYKINKGTEEEKEEDEKEAFERFVKESEKIIKKEQSSWAQYSGSQHTHTNNP
jgi:NAD(P)H-nitrite reductase large subunit